MKKSAELRPQRAKRRGETVPVMRPLLPSAARLLPYLRRIDAARTYTNWGPLVTEFEHRLSRLFNVANECAVSASSGTAALVGAILASAGRARPERPVAIVPAFTFVATAIAVAQCGYQPHLMDVSNDSWLLDADRLDHHPRLSQVGLIVPVATFGRAVAQAPWLAFRKRTGIPVVIDGAASFEGVTADRKRFLGKLPTALSFHATKSFATGEGGCVVTTDIQLSRRVSQALNFGFSGSRNSRMASTNGKMSEYHAAVGLAELDGWKKKRTALRTVAERYRHHMDGAGLPGRILAAPNVASCYALFKCIDAAEAARVQQSLENAHVDFRYWYGSGLHQQSYFAEVSHDVLDVTERIAPLVIGLPTAVDLPDAAIRLVVSVVKKSVG